MSARASLLALLLAAAPAAALEVVSTSPARLKGAPKGDFSFGAVAVKGVEWRDGAVVMPQTENKGRRYADIRLLTRAAYDKLAACFLAGCAGSRPKGRPSFRIEELKPLKSPVRVANAELNFDGELLVTAGVMASKREEGTYWVAFPAALSFSDPAFKSSVESAVIAAWTKRK